MDEALQAHWRAFGAHLRQEIEAAGLNLSEFAERAGLTLTQVSRILNGQSGTRRATLPRFVQALRWNDPERVRDLYRKAGFLPPVELETARKAAPRELAYELDEAEKEELISAFSGIPPTLRPGALRVLKAFLENLPDTEEGGPAYGRRRR